MGEPDKLHRYEGHGGVVTYDAKRCIHAAECVQRLPAVFDSKAKPWINPDGADADAIAATVERCPSGALQFEPSAGRRESAPANNTAALTANGPTYLRADITLVLADGATRSATRMALCRCGASLNKPYCDGSHRRIGFQHDGALRASETPPAAVAGGALTIRARANGPLMLTGPLTVIGTNGRAQYAETTFLCRCGTSGNKPYCDGAHKKIGFAA